MLADVKLAGFYECVDSETSDLHAFNIQQDQSQLGADSSRDKWRKALYGKSVWVPALSLQLTSPCLALQPPHRTLSTRSLSKKQFACVND
jgi:hypothetical protein